MPKAQLQDGALPLTIICQAKISLFLGALWLRDDDGWWLPSGLRVCEPFYSFLANYRVPKDLFILLFCWRLSSLLTGWSPMMEVDLVMVATCLFSSRLPCWQPDHGLRTRLCFICLIWLFLIFAQSLTHASHSPPYRLRHTHTHTLTGLAKSTIHTTFPSNGCH